MKKSIFRIAILLSAFAIMATSCSKDEDDLPAILEGNYKVIIDGKTVAEGKTDEVGMLGNTISLSVGESFAILITEVPVAVGDEAQIGGDTSDASVTILGTNLLKNGEDELYFSITGTIRRSTASKITFEGTCSEFGGTAIYTFSGTAESDVFKVI